MKPIFLSITGLNSIEATQTVDFTRLTAYGLFGIFGPTGSGKSTVIDGITLALYGEMARFQKDKHKEWINVNTAETAVSFTFSLAGQKNATYVAERKYKRKDEKIRAEAVRLYEKTENGIVVLSDKLPHMNKEIVRLIGLSYDDFTRSVLLPQGRFSEFLLLENKERCMMLERIFRLEAYGEAMSIRIRKEASRAANRLETVSASLAVYQRDGAITHEVLQDLRKQLQTERKMLSESQALYIALRGNHEKNIKYQAAARRYETACLTEKSLCEREGEMSAIGLKLQRSEQADKVLPYYSIAEETRQKITANESRIEAGEKALCEAIAAEDKARADYEGAVNRKNAEYPQLLKKGSDIEQALKIMDNMAGTEKEREALLVQYKALEASQRQEQERLTRLEQRIQSTEEALQATLQKRETRTVDPKERQLAENGAAEERKYIDLTRRLTQHRSQKAKAEAQFTAIQSSLQETEATLLWAAEKSCNAAKEKAVAARESLTQAEAVFKEAESQYVFMQKTWEEARFRYEFAVTAQALAPGQPCPLCGSLEHPHPAAMLSETEWIAVRSRYEHAVEVWKKTDTLRRETESGLRLAEVEWAREADILKSIEKTRQATNFTHEPIIVEDSSVSLIEIRNKANEALQKLLLRQAGAEEAVSHLTAQCQVLEKELLEVKKTVGDGGFLEKLALYAQWDQERASIEKQESQCRETLVQLRGDREQSITAFAELENRINTIRTQGVERKNFLTKMQAEVIAILYPDAPDSTYRIPVYRQEAQTRLREAEEAICALNEGEAKATQKLRQVNAHRQRVALALEACKENRQTLSQLSKEQETALQQALSAHHFASIDEALQATLLGETATKLTKELEEYRTQVQVVSREMIALSEELDGVDIKTLDRQVETDTIKIRSMEVDMDRIKMQIARMMDKLTAMEADYEAIQQLRREQETLTRQHDLLSDLTDLFKGNTFVEYMAAGQLRYITAEASLRLKEMTAGRYALELDGTDFTIRDDLNGGVRRSPRTLSGGETFMAALCLSLSLSSRIQLQHNAALEFFFLDEGFGTLDAAVLEDVMAALERLPLERMTVGMISHVDALRQRIPRQLIITPAQAGLHGALIREA